MPKNHSLFLDPTPFEAQFLGAPVARLILDEPPDHTALADALPALIAQAQKERMGLIACRLDDSDTAGEEILKRARFRHIETLVTLSRPLAKGDATLPPKPTQEVRLATEADHARCMAIAETAFCYDRFHADPKLPDSAANALKAQWVKNDLAGRADRAWVVCSPQGEVMGFNLCLLREDRAIIDLIAVDPAGHKQGYGKALVSASIHHYAAQGIGQFSLGTQADNAPSRALYEQMGLKPLSVAKTFHWTP